MKKKVALHNLGCKVNAYETEAMGQMFLGKGYEIVEFKEGADVYVINTCTVTNIADRKSRQMLHRAKKMNENALVVAVGCYAQAFSNDLEKDDAIDIIVGNDMKNDIINIVENHIKKSVVDINDTKVKREFEELNIESMEEHTRAYIKIQDGCNQFCTYCIIPYARGRVRSRNKDNVLEEISLIAKEKEIKEVVITGIHVASYGKDFKEEYRLIDLLEDINKIDGIERIRLGSIEPLLLTEEFLERLTNNVTKFCSHFHLSLQSACTETLKRMNRRYTIDEFKDIVNRIRRFYKEPILTTDIIVGFPEESDEEFDITVKNLKEIAFYKMHVFKYSPRKGTKAAGMKGQISGDIKEKRSKCLLTMSDEFEIRYQKDYIGKDVNVLIEELDEDNYYKGHTENFIMVKVKSSEDIINKVVRINVVSQDGLVLIGKDM